MKDNLFAALAFVCPLAVFAVGVAFALLDGRFINNFNPYLAGGVLGSILVFSGFASTERFWA